MRFVVDAPDTMALWLSLLCICIAATHSKAQATTLVWPKCGLIVAAADYSFYNYTDYSHVKLQTGAHRLKKILDLSEIDQADFAAVRTARVSIFMYVEDGQGDGFNGAFNVVVNGHQETFPTRDLVSTGWGWFNTRLAINWFDFDIPADYLVRGPNEVVLHLSSAAKENDDRLVVGIDMFEDQGCSTRSTDGGVTWFARPLNKNGFSGEYMIRIVLVTEEADSKNLTFNHQDFPALPSIDMCPQVRALPAIPNQSPRLIEGQAADTFVNGAMSVQIRLTNGLQLSRLHHQTMNVSVIQQQTKESIFVLEINGRCLTGSDFVLEGKEVLSADSEAVSVVYDISCAPAKLTGRLRITMDRSEELRLGLSIQNRSDKNQVVKVAFPVLGGIGWSEGFLKDRYLYPFATGIVLSHPGRFRSGYGGGRTYFQTMASFCPEMGGGLYLRVNDQSGEYKILHLLKADASEGDPTFRIDPALVDAQNGRAPFELILWDPFEEALGTSMAFSYFGRGMQPGEQWRLASATLGVMNGDWREAMESYRKWFDGFAHKNRYPNKLTDAFNYDSTGPEWGFRGPGDKEAYNTNPTKWGHKRMGHVQADFMTKMVDGLEHSGYWEHEEITDEMQMKHKTAAAKHGLTYKLFPDRYGMLEGKYVLWGNQGDYGLRGYNQRWGGLPALRKYVAALKSQGYIPTFYVNKAEAALGSVMGHAHGADWATMYPEGHYFWPYYDWQMCMDHQPWRDYLAQTCARIIEETGGDGVRIDELGGASRICLNKKHPHTFARWRHYNELQAQSDAARQVRQAMDAVNRDSVLLTESIGFDVLGQYVDGSLLYDLTEQPFTSHVATNWEGFVGLNIYRFFFPRHKIFDYQISEKHPEWRLFNATGAFNREWCYREHERQMLKDNADAFGSLAPEPMIGTWIPMVYLNRFSANGKTVYTVYNASTSSVRSKLIAVTTVNEYHVVDLYRYNKIETFTEADQTILCIELEPRSITCIAHLPKLLDVRLRGPKLIVQTPENMEGAAVRVVDRFGATIAEGKIRNAACELSVPLDAGRLICKLYREQYLIDASSFQTARTK